MARNFPLPEDEILDDDVLAHGRGYVKRYLSGLGQTGYLNREAYRSWYDFLFEIAISSFKWEGLPPEIDPRFIEYALLTRGLGGFFALGRGTQMWGFAAATPVGNLNLYYNPNRIMLQSPNGGVPWYRHAYYFIKGDIMYEPDAVLCWNSLSRRSFVPTIRYYARRLAHFDRTIDVNVMAQQTPFVVQTTKDTQRDAQNAMMQILGHSSTITVNEKFGDFTGISVLPTVAPYVADKLNIDKGKILDDYLGMVGVDNTNTEKRERVSDREASSNNEQIMLIRNSRLRCREEFCQKVAIMTDGDYTPTVKYAAPYRQEGTVDMGRGADVR